MIDKKLPILQNHHARPQHGCSLFNLLMPVLVVAFLLVWYARVPRCP
jgi:hypothetical protein